MPSSPSQPAGRVPARRRRPRPAAPRPPCPRAARTGWRRLPGAQRVACLHAARAPAARPAVPRYPTRRRARCPAARIGSAGRRARCASRRRRAWPRTSPRRPVRAGAAGRARRARRRRRPGWPIPAGRPRRRPPAASARAMTASSEAAWRSSPEPSSSSELVATQARHRVGLAHALLHALGEGLQHRVAGGVAVLVVDALERIHVHQHHGEAGAVLARARSPRPCAP